MNSPYQTERHTVPEMFSRAFWMMIGPMTMVPITYKVIEHGSGWLTLFDLLFVAVLGGMFLARWFEFFKGNPRTAEGAPANNDHLRRYAIGLVAIGVPLWIAANVLGNYVRGS